MKLRSHIICVKEDGKVVWDYRAKTNVKHTGSKNNVMEEDMNLD
jgi:hypothetical protein